jgi:hypothetical protein
LEGKGCLRNESAAVGYFERASNGSELDDLGDLLHEGNAERRLNGRRGNAFAQNIFGECLENGRCVQKDLVRAAEYYRLSAEQGNASAQFNFGFCLAKGDGVAQDLIRAAEYYRLSAKQGNAAARFNFGVCLAKGEGVRVSTVERDSRQLKPEMIWSCSGFRAIIFIFRRLHSHSGNPGKGDSKQKKRVTRLIMEGCTSPIASQSRDQQKNRLKCLFPDPDQRHTPV